jgi:hypothetical protein
MINPVYNEFVCKSKNNIVNNQMLYCRPDSHMINNFYLCIMPNNTSPHILNTSATLLGFCLFVITSLHIANKIATQLVDEFTSVIAVLLTFSCIFSFVSIRTKIQRKEKRLEAIADYFFIAALIGILIIILLITFHFFK